MQARFLLGPAGSGKTFRCLAEIRAELRKAPEGPPLIFLAPKQATFQLERQLLADESLAGYTRLQILSFDRLARFIFSTLQKAPPKLLDEEGRLMVLRGLLARKRDELKLFRASARLTGFARQLSLALRELQRHQLTPDSLRQTAAGLRAASGLSLKLHDLATLLQHYLDWLAAHGLQDADCLLDAATAALSARTAQKNSGDIRDGNKFGIRNSEFGIGRLWLDGFAEFSPQEMALLTAFAPLCQRATLAFCLEDEASAAGSWLSHWSLVQKAVIECRTRLSALPGATILVEVLRRGSDQNRFAKNSSLAFLENSWAAPQPSPPTANSQPEVSVRVLVCPNPEAEAVAAAREILRFVRKGGRFREAGVILRRLEGYHEALQTVFARYEIPFFLDRRESVTHHPLAELTRSALRTVTFQWAHDDWFAALKSGLVCEDEAALDELENEALARGWKGTVWQRPLEIPDHAGLAVRLEKLRQKITPPFQRLAVRLGALQNKPTGPELAGALRDFWRELDVEEKLRELSEPASGSERRSSISVHATVWEQMNAWLDNLELAFPGEAIPLRDWLPILEAGLANLTVGAIPPALDQVLIGAIDRSRNPELKLALVLGLNESVFPAPPEAGALLTETDRAELEARGVSLSLSTRQQLGRERYYGYIACTRARQRLVLTCSATDANDKPLNQSPFLLTVKRVFPALEFEDFAGASDWRDSEHASELVVPLLKIQSAKLKLPDWENLAALPAMAKILGSFAELKNPEAEVSLGPELAETLYGKILHTSVSRLEQFAACPFRFFVHSGLRAAERKTYEPDVREQGSFQHDALKFFHEQLRAEKKRWRDLTPAEARDRMGRIAAALEENYRDGLMRSSDEARFTARVLAAALQDFVETLVAWMRGQYAFDPAGVELPFGEAGSSPAWELDTGEGRRLALRGRIDRVDLCAGAEPDEAQCVVVDYKSGQKKLDPVLVAHGVQLQLLAYLNVLRHWPNPRELFGAGRLVPAGVFYVSLRGRNESAPNRGEALAEADSVRKLAYRHSGRFDARFLRQLDSRENSPAGDQFNYRLNADGSLRKNSLEALDSGQFKKLLIEAEENLKRIGREIFSGATAVAPYRKGSATACDQCDYRAICRIDPWTHSFRALKPVPTET